MEYHKINQDDLKVLSSYISDPARFITNPTTHWDHDQFNTVCAMPDLVIQPVTNEEVQKVEGGISLDMIKMNKLLEYDPTSLTMTVQAGRRLIDTEKFLADKPFSYMPAPAMHWASIGGNIDTDDAGRIKSC